MPFILQRITKIRQNLERYLSWGTRQLRRKLTLCV